MKRIYHPYWLWEEFQCGMWRLTGGQERRDFLQAAFEFTGNAKRYGRAMRKVIIAWPISCEHNLTETSMNRLAWIGHAATQWAINCPEDVTRQAWGMLTDKQREDADAEAQGALDEWTARYESTRAGVYQQLGEAGLSARYPRRSRPPLRGFEQSTQLQEYLPGLA